MFCGNVLCAIIVAKWKVAFSGDQSRVARASLSVLSSDQSSDVIVT